MDTAKSNSSTDQSNATSSFGATNSDIGAYQKQLASFVSGNPYTQGGQYDQTINPALANASDAGSNSLKGALQSQALRTGQNSAADAATAASGAQANTRALSGNLATAQQGRISSDAGYNQTALGATATPISAQSQLYGTALSGGNSALNTGESAAQTPSFWDEVGNSFAGIPSAAASGAAGAATGAIIKCWVAAEAFGSWTDVRTLLVRGWVFGTFQRTFLGGMIAKLYLRFGERVAEQMRRHKSVRWVFVRLANLALRQARKEASG